MDSYKLKGNILTKRNSFEQAKKVYEEAISIDPNQIQLVDLIGRLDELIEIQNNNAINMQNRETEQMLNALNAVSNSFNSISTSLSNLNSSINSNKPNTQINNSQQISGNNSNRAMIEYELNKAKKRLSDAQKNQQNASSLVVKQQYNSIITQEEAIIRNWEEKLRNLK